MNAGGVKNVNGHSGLIIKMKQRNIFDSWGTKYNYSYDEILSESPASWASRLTDRGMLIFKNMGTELTDEQIHRIGKQFGKVWTREDYHTASRGDPTINDNDVFPVSHFTTQNNFWMNGPLAYHADMPHIGENSYPCRILYMVRNPSDGSGNTYWLNLERAWAMFTEEEKAYYSDVDLYYHYMYNPGTEIEKFGFTKTNPYTGRVSPKINNIGSTFRWMHHIDKGGKTIDNLPEFITEAYKLCESKTDALYCHKWENGDMIVFDNWCSVHRRDAVTIQPGEPDRLLKRITLNIKL